jgi:hypothetical protein
MFDTALLEEMERERQSISSLSEEIQSTYEVRAFTDGVVLSSWLNSHGERLYLAFEYTHDQDGEVVPAYGYFTAYPYHMSEKYRLRWFLWNEAYHDFLYGIQEEGVL